MQIEASLGVIAVGDDVKLGGVLVRHEREYSGPTPKDPRRGLLHDPNRGSILQQSLPSDHDLISGLEALEHLNLVRPGEALLDLNLGCLSVTHAEHLRGAVVIDEGHFGDK